MTSPSTLAPPSSLRALAPWFIAVVLHSYAACLITIGCYDFADQQLGASASMRLWMSALWGLAYIFIALASGKLAARWGPRKTLFLMLPLCFAAELLTLLILRAPKHSPWSPWLLVLLMLPINITSSSCWPALETAVSRSPARMRLSSRMALYNIAWSTTGFAAVFTRGPLEQAWWGWVFLAPALATLATCLLLFTCSISDSMMGREHVPDEAPGETVLHTPHLRKRAATLLHMAWIGNALSYVASNVVLPVLTLLAVAAWTQHYGLGPSLAIAAFVTSVWAFTRTAGFLITIKWTRWHYKARWLVASQLALTISFFAMLFFHHPLTLILSQIIFGLATSLVYSSSLYYAMHTSEGAGGHAGFHEALIGLGICIGPTIGALAGAGNSASLPDQLTALHRVALSVTALLLLGTLLMALLARRRPQISPL